MQFYVLMHFSWYYMYKSNKNGYISLWPLTWKLKLMAVAARKVFASLGCILSTVMLFLKFLRANVNSKFDIYLLFHKMHYVYSLSVLCFVVREFPCPEMPLIALTNHILPLLQSHGRKRLNVRMRNYNRSQLLILIWVPFCAITVITVQKVVWCVACH